MRKFLSEGLADLSENDAPGTGPGREAFSWELWGDHEPVPMRWSSLPAVTAPWQVQGAELLSPVLLLVRASLPLQDAMIRDVSESAHFN